MKNDNDLSVSLSGSKRRSWDAQTQAMLLHRGIKLIRDQAFERLGKGGFFEGIKQEIESLFKQKNPDKEVLRHLEIILNSGHPMSEKERLNHVVQETVNQCIEKQSAFEENNHILLTLSSYGDLYRKPKDKYCYSMRGGDTKRLKLLRALIERGSLYESKKLQTDVGYINYETMADAIKEINRTAQTKLELPKEKENRLIDSRPHSGYMINPIYPIKLES